MLQQEDIISTLQALKMIEHWKDQHVIRVKVRASICDAP